MERTQTECVFVYVVLNQILVENAWAACGGAERCLTAVDIDSPIGGGGYLIHPFCLCQLLVGIVIDAEVQMFLAAHEESVARLVCHREPSHLGAVAALLRFLMHLEEILSVAFIHPHSAGGVSVGIVLGVLAEIFHLIIFKRQQHLCPYFREGLHLICRHHFHGDDDIAGAAYPIQLVGSQHNFAFVV